MSGQLAVVSTSAVAAPTRSVAVYPLVPTRSFDEPLTYSLEQVAADDIDTIRVGSLVAIPVGSAERPGVVAQFDPDAPMGVTLKSVARVLELPRVPAALIELAAWTADSYGCARTRALALVVPPQLSAHARASSIPLRRTQLAVRLAPDADLADAKLTARARAVAQALPANWRAMTDVASELATTPATLRKLAASGVAEIDDRFVEELDATDAEPERVAARAISPAEVALTSEQHAAVDAIEAATSGDPASLLAGITGSGKTEVYLELIEHALERGEGAIVLVPEIALTPQTARRFLRRFPGLVEVLHSGLTAAQRRDAWLRIASGAAPVVVGPRSAVFAPIARLGVLVVDEEHDNSYKQESEPRYDARRVAFKRALLEGAHLVFGSATPRPESWHGIARRIRMTQRASGGRLAPVDLVDLRERGDTYPLTDVARAALDQTLRRGRKAIVLQNRRGYAAALHCRSCGTGVRCVNCDVSLTVHGNAAHVRELVCHHCGLVVQAPTRCPACGSAEVTRVGVGTERVERDLAELFDVPIHRLDADVSRERGALDRVLDAFAQPGPQLLVGTQMVAKGHDFPDVELALVVDADTALAIPDFRAEERAFSLVAQLAGRAGRQPETAGHARVVVQSWNVEQEFLTFARSHDVEGFLTAELARRREFGYPPFSRLVRLLISSPERSVLAAWSGELRKALARLDAGAVKGPAPLMRIQNRHRAQVVVMTQNVAPIAAAVRAFLRRTERDRARQDVRVVLDVDPQSLI